MTLSYIPTLSNTTTRRWMRTCHRLLCPICHHDSWCSISGDGLFALCMRIEAGSLKATKNGGYLHKLTTGHVVSSSARWAGNSPTAPSRHDWALLARNYQSSINPDRLKKFTDILGVSATSLRRLGLGWSCEHSAWSFPMTDTAGHVRGIRLRLLNGRKLAVAGSHDGLFIPIELPSGLQLVICEGPTDTAAMLDWGFAAVGRPSCRGGVGLLVELIRTRRPSQVIIAADNDGPGRSGAADLASTLVMYTTVSIISPPAEFKDVRAWKQAGATAADIEAVIALARIQPRQRITVRVVPRNGGRHV